eukprot:g14317.t1
MATSDAGHVEVVFKEHIAEPSMSLHSRQISFPEVVLLKKVIILNKNEKILDRGIEFAGQTHPLVKPGRLQVFVKEDVPDGLLDSGGAIELSGGGGGGGVGVGGGGDNNGAKMLTSFKNMSTFTVLEGKQGGPAFGKGLGKTGLYHAGGKDGGGYYSAGIQYIPTRPNGVEIDSIVLQGEFTKLSVVVFAVLLNRAPLSYEFRKLKLPHKCLRPPVADDDIDVEFGSGVPAWGLENDGKDEWALENDGADIFSATSSERPREDHDLLYQKGLRLVDGCLRRILHQLADDDSSKSTSTVLAACRLLFLGDLVAEPVELRELLEELELSDRTTILQAVQAVSVSVHETPTFLKNLGKDLKDWPAAARESICRALVDTLLRHRDQQTNLLAFLHLVSRDESFVKPLFGLGSFLSVMRNEHRVSVFGETNSVPLSEVLGRENKRRKLMAPMVPGMMPSGGADGPDLGEDAIVDLGLRFTSREFKNGGNGAKRLLLDRLLEHDHVLRVFAETYAACGGGAGAEELYRRSTVAAVEKEASSFYLWGYYPRTALEQRVAAWGALENVASAGEAGQTARRPLRILYSVIAELCGFHRGIRGGADSLLSGMSAATGGGRRTSISPYFDMIQADGAATDRSPVLDPRQLPEFLEKMLITKKLPQLLATTHNDFPALTSRIVLLLLCCRRGGGFLFQQKNGVELSLLETALKVPEVRSVSALRALLGENGAEDLSQKLPVFARVLAAVPVRADSGEEQEGGSMGVDEDDEEDPTMNTHDEEQLVETLPALLAAARCANQLVEHFVRSASCDSMNITGENVKVPEHPAGKHSEAPLSKLCKLLHELAGTSLGRFVLFRAFLHHEGVCLDEGKNRGKIPPGQKKQTAWADRQAALEIGNETGNGFFLPLILVLLDCLERSVLLSRNSPERTYHPLPRFLTGLLHSFLLPCPKNGYVEDDGVLILQAAVKFGARLSSIVDKTRKYVTHHPRLDVESGESENVEKMRALVRGGRKNMDEVFDLQVEELGKQLAVFRSSGRAANMIVESLSTFGGDAVNSAALAGRSVDVVPGSVGDASMKDKEKQKEETSKEEDKDKGVSYPILDWDFQRLSATDTHNYFKKCVKQIGFIGHRCKSVDVVEVQFPDYEQNKKVSAAPAVADKEKERERMPAACLRTEIPLLTWQYVAQKCTNDQRFCVELFLAHVPCGVGGGNNLGEMNYNMVHRPGAATSSAVGDGGLMVDGGLTDAALAWGVDGDDEGSPGAKNLLDNSAAEGHGKDVDEDPFDDFRVSGLGADHENPLAALHARLRNTGNRPLEIYNRFQRILHSTLVKCAGGLNLNLEAISLQQPDQNDPQDGQSYYCYSIQSYYLVLAESVLCTVNAMLTAFGRHGLNLPKYQSEDLLRVLLLLASRICSAHFFQLPHLRYSPIFALAEKALAALTNVFRTWGSVFGTGSCIGLHGVLPKVIDFATALPCNHAAGLWIFATMVDSQFERQLFGTKRIRWLEFDLHPVTTAEGVGGAVGGGGPQTEAGSSSLSSDSHGVWQLLGNKVRMGARAGVESDGVNVESDLRVENGEKTNLVKVDKRIVSQSCLQRLLRGRSNRSSSSYGYDYDYVLLEVGCNQMCAASGQEAVYANDAVSELHEFNLFQDSGVRGGSEGQTQSLFRTNPNLQLYRALHSPANVSLHTEIDLILNKIRHVFSHHPTVKLGAGGGGSSSTASGDTTTSAAALAGTLTLDQTLPHCSVSRKAREGSLLNRQKWSCSRSTGLNKKNAETSGGHNGGRDNAAAVVDPVSDAAEDPSTRTTTNTEAAFTRAVLEDDSRFSELNILDLLEFSIQTIALAFSSSAVLHVLVAKCLVKLFAHCHVKWMKLLLKVASDLLADAEAKTKLKMEAELNQTRAAGAENTSKANLTANGTANGSTKLSSLTNTVTISGPAVPNGGAASAMGAATPTSTAIKRPVQALGRLLLVLERVAALSPDVLTLQEGFSFVDVFSLKLIHLSNKYPNNGFEQLLVISFRLLARVFAAGSKVYRGAGMSDFFARNESDKSDVATATAGDDPTRQTDENIALANKLLQAPSAAQSAKSRKRPAAAPPLEETEVPEVVVQPQVGVACLTVKVSRAPAVATVAVRALSKAVCTQILDEFGTQNHRSSSLHVVAEAVNVVAQLYASECYLLSLLYQHSDNGDNGDLMLFQFNSAVNLSKFVAKLERELLAKNFEKNVENCEQIATICNALGQLLVRILRDSNAFRFDVGKIIGSPATIAESVEAVLTGRLGGSSADWLAEVFSAAEKMTEGGLLAGTSTSSSEVEAERSRLARAKQVFEGENVALWEEVKALLSTSIGAEKSSGTGSNLWLPSRDPSASFVQENYRKGGSLCCRRNFVGEKKAVSANALKEVLELDQCEEWQRFAVLEKSLPGEAEWLFDSSVDRRKQALEERNLTARKKERLKEALESQQAEDYWNSDAHYGQYYRRDKQAKAKQLALQQAPEKERMRALRDQADANFLKAYLATGGERAAEPLGDGKTEPSGAVEKAPKTLAEEFADLASRDAQAKRAVRDQNRLKTDPRMRALVSQYLDEYPLVKKFLEEGD